MNILPSGVLATASSEASAVSGPKSGEKGQGGSISTLAEGVANALSYEQENADRGVKHQLTIPRHETIERSTHTVKNARSIVIVRQNGVISCKKGSLKGKCRVDFSDKNAQSVALECGSGVDSCRECIPPGLHFRGKRQYSESSLSFGVVTDD